MKIILALPIIIGAFILTGCKSPSEVRQSGPEEIFHSNKNVNDVSEVHFNQAGRKKVF